MGCPKGSPALSADAPRPPLETSASALCLSGPIARAEIAGICERIRALLEASDASLVDCDVGGLVDPDAVTVDALARVQLTAHRLGCSVRLRHVGGELQDLLALMGLGDVLPFGVGSGLEPSGKAEEREQARGVEEEADPDDLTG